MSDSNLKEHLVNRILMRVQMPAQYIGGEWNMVRKDPRGVRGRLCLAFPDAYTIGMSHHGLQVLYSLMNARDDWYCERVFTPWPDMEAHLREADLPLYSLETFTPLAEFDVLGFSLQYEICYTNLLTMLDLGRIPLRGDQRTMHHPLVIAGGPCAQNPEPLSPAYTRRGKMGLRPNRCVPGAERPIEVFVRRKPSRLAAPPNSLRESCAACPQGAKQ